MTLCLSIRDLSMKREKNGARFTLLVPRLDIFSGQMLAVLGRSGYGKSTLLDVLALILRPDRAAFTLCGTAGDTNLLAVSGNRLAAVRGLDIAGQLDKKPQHLSGGQRQRAAIARALLHQPRVILANEPTAAVDQNTAQDIAGDPARWPVRATLTVNGEARGADFTLHLLPDASVPEGTARLPLSLLGALNLLRERPLTVTGPAGKEHFLLGRRGYSGFRLYAAGLDAVAPLAVELENMGIKVITRTDRIDEVRALDKSLSLLFWVITLASLAGGLACIVTNIYATVERKRRELAVLRLLGVHGAALVLFPLVAVSGLPLGGMTGALTLFNTLAALINALFSAHLGAGEAFCALSLTTQAQAAGAALGVGLLAETLKQELAGTEAALRTMAQLRKQADADSARVWAKIAGERDVYLVVNLKGYAITKDAPTENLRRRAEQFAYNITVGLENYSEIMTELAKLPKTAVLDGFAAFTARLNEKIAKAQQEVGADGANSVRDLGEQARWLEVTRGYYEKFDREKHADVAAWRADYAQTPAR